MYIIHNLTNRTVILSDLRVEIGPKRVLDLERVTARHSIDASADLREALYTKRLALGRHTLIRTKAPKVVEKVVERVIEKHSIDEEKLRELIKSTVSEQMNKQQQHGDIEDKVKRAVSSSVGSLISDIRDTISNIQIAPQQQKTQTQDLNIDPEKFAELSQKSIEKISSDIETGGPVKTKTINIINKRDASDLANELE